MKGKKCVLLLTLTFLLAVIIIPAPLVKPAPLVLESPMYQTRIYFRECPPPAGNVSGVAVNDWIYLTVDIQSPSAWDDTAQGIIGYEFSIHVDPNVLLVASPLHKGEIGCWLYDYIDLNMYYGHEPLYLVEEINMTTGDIVSIGENIAGWETLAKGAGGSSYDGSLYGSTYGVMVLRFRSKSLTAYTRIDIHNANYVIMNASAPDGFSKIPFDVVDDGHYNAPPFKWQHSNATLIDPTNPVGTSWHELYPNYCTSTTINAWVDNTDGVLSPCDYIQLDSTWWHVEEVTITIETKTAYGVPDSSTNSPSTTSGGWTTPEGAYADGGGSAYIRSAKPSASQYYGGYGFAIPTDAVITSVRVRLDAWGTEDLFLQVSEDGGSTWLASQWSTQIVGSETTYWVNVTTWTSWTPAKINSDNIHTQVWTYTVGGAGDMYLDWIPIEVIYESPLPMYIEYLGGFDFMDEAMADANGTYWHEVYPEFSTIYNLTGWEDSDVSGNITYCDYIDLTDFNATSTKNTYHVEDVDTDIIVSGPVPSPPEFPLGAAVEIGLIVAVAYVWLRSRRKTKITKRAKLAY